jgi:hypothetical protein
VFDKLEVNPIAISSYCISDNLQIRSVPAVNRIPRRHFILRLANEDVVFDQSMFSFFDIDAKKPIDDSRVSDREVVMSFDTDDGEIFDMAKAAISELYTVDQDMIRFNHQDLVYTLPINHRHINPKNCQWLINRDL